MGSVFDCECCEDFNLCLSFPQDVLKVYSCDHQLTDAWLYSFEKIAPSTPQPEHHEWVVCKAKGYFITISKNRRQIELSYRLKVLDAISMGMVKGATGPREERHKLLSKTTAEALSKFIEGHPLIYDSEKANSKQFAEAVYSFLQ